MSQGPFETFLSTPEMQDVFGAASVVQAMLDFEAALALAEADEGLMTPEAAAVIAAACHVERFDVPALLAASGRAGSLAIPLVKQLGQAVKGTDAAAAQAVHLGSTSQDVIDTGMVLVTRRALALIDDDLSALIAALLSLAERHGDAPLLGRTLMQPASVVAFGFKVAAWTAPLVRAQARLHEAAAAALKLQFGGAVGTLATLGPHGPAVAGRVAARLGLPPWEGAWHTQRDDWVRLGAEVGVLVGSQSKVARDWSLMGQGEVGEVAEPTGAGRGGSTALPHKRNPVACMVALAAAQRTPHRVAALLGAMAQEHERGLGNWQAELAEWAGLFVSAHGALRALAEAAAGLQVFPARMRAHIDALQGLASAEACAMRLAPVLGKPDAQALLERLSQRVMDEPTPPPRDDTERAHSRTDAERLPLETLVLEAVAADPRLAAAVPALDIERLFDPAHAAGPALERARESFERLRPRAAALAEVRPFAPPFSPASRGTPR